MIGVSFAIMAVILVMAAMAARARKRELALMALPFVCVPLAYLVGEALLYSLRTATNLPFSALRSIAVLVGALVGLALCLVAARRFHERRARLSYLAFSWVFLILLAFAYFLKIL